MAPIEFKKIEDKSKIEELIKQADKAWERAYEEYSTSEGWKLKKEKKDGALFFSKKKPDNSGRKMIKIQATTNLPMDYLIRRTFSVSEAENVPELYHLIAMLQILQELDENTVIAYQLSNPVGAMGHMVTPRDMLYVRRSKRIDGDKFLACMTSVELDGVAPVKNVCRAQVDLVAAAIEVSPCKDSAKCFTTTIVDADLKMPSMPVNVFNKVQLAIFKEEYKMFRKTVEKLHRENKVTA